MLGLFGLDFVALLGERYGFVGPRYRSLGSSIVGIGLFTTFLGILSGLYGFDARSVESSVPQLLDGLRFAFAGSVLGMFLSLILSVTQKLLGAAVDDEAVLQSIDKNIATLVAGFEEPEALVKQFGNLKEFLAIQFARINHSLDSAIQELGKGATAELIEALKGVIGDFNQNLSEQFGENFKELNAACLQLLEWQRSYKEHVEISEDALEVIIESLKQSCSAAESMNESNRITQESCAQVAGLIEKYDLQIVTLESYLQSCKSLGDDAGVFLAKTEEALGKSSEHLSEFAGVIEHSVGRQSTSLAQLTEDIDRELPKALGELERVLCSLTEQFATDYRALFQHVTNSK